MTRVQAKKSDKVHPLKVKEAMSSVDKSTIEELQKKDSPLKKCFDRVGKPITRDNYVGEFYIKNGLLYQKHQAIIKQDAIGFCCSCDVCQRTVKRDSVKKVQLGSMPLINTSFKMVTVDILVH